MTHNGDGREFTIGALTFIIRVSADEDRIGLWLKTSVDSEWIFVHYRNIPEGMTPARAIELMRLFVMGAIDSGTYRRLLPEE